MDQQAEKDKTERVRGDSKVESNDSPEISNRGRHQTFPASFWGYVFLQHNYFAHTHHIEDAYHFGYLEQKDQQQYKSKCLRLGKSMTSTQHVTSQCSTIFPETRSIRRIQ